MFFYIFAALCLGHYDGPAWLINLAYILAVWRFFGFWFSVAIGITDRMNWVRK